jgi:ABC-type oligopeptide transport system substrate-binding subunit
VCDPELDKLITAWGSATTQAEYERLAAVIEKYLLDNYYAIPVIKKPITFASNDQIRDDYSPGIIATGFNERGMVWNP